MHTIALVPNRALWAFIVLISGSLGASAGQETNNFFPLMAWNGAPSDAATLKQMRECGLTVAGFVSPQELDLCQAAGLKAIVSDPRVSNYDWKHVDEAAAHRNIASLIAEVGKHPAVYGYYLRDEPGAELFAGLATVSRIVQELAPGKWPYINLYPNYASRQQLGSSSYREHLERFVSECKPPVLSYDHYALMDDGSLRRGYWQNLEQMRTASKEHAIPFWNIVLTVAHFNYREPSAADLRFQVYTTLAYGGRGIAYFTYFAPQVGNYRAAPVDQFGKPTAAWHHLQNVNLQVAKLSPALLELTSDDVYHFGSVPEGSHGPGAGSLIKAMNNGEFMAGDFTHTDSSRYVMIVNKDFAKSHHCAPQFTRKPKRVQMVSPYTGQLTEYSGEQQWLAPGQGVLLKLTPPQVDEVVVVFKTHFDIGYTDLASNVVQRYRTSMIDQALAVVDQNRDLPPSQQFVWTIPGWPMAKIAEDWPGQTLTRQQRILAAFKEGRFAVHALPFSMHTELLEMEDLVRGLGYAADLARAAGLDLPRDAKMTDVPCHSWFVPTLLRHAGVDFLHLGCNAASSSPEVPLLFWWEGPDKSRLLTMYSATGYGSGLIPPPNWPHKTWLALIHTGDNHGPPTPDEVRKLLAQAARDLPGVRVRIGRLSDFADALLAENPALPVIRGDMPDTWIHGPMCDPAGARLARELRPLIPAAESLDTELRAWGVTEPGAVTALTQASENSLLYGEHTWGGALYWVTRYSAGKRLPYGQEWQDLRAQGKYNRLEASWDEHSSYIHRVDELLTPVLESRLKMLAGSVNHAGPRVVVYNPLPWKRTGLVSVPLSRLAWPAMKAADSDETTAAVYGESGYVFVARDVPAMGYRTFVPADLAPPAGGLDTDPHTRSIESPFFKAVVDPASGTVRSLISKPSGRELVDSAAPQGLGQYLYERFDHDHVQAFVKAYVKINADWATNELGKPNLPPSHEVPYQALSPDHFDLVLSTTPIAAVAQMNAKPSGFLPAVTTKLTLYRELPFADLEITLHEKPADSWPEAGWLCLPFNIASPQFRLGRLGSIIDPRRDIVPGVNRHLLALNTGLTVTSGEGVGVGLCALDNPLVSLGQPGCWKYSRDFVPEQARVYVNLFNNQWTTNFRLWNSGTWTARVRIWAVQTNDNASALLTPSMEARLPLLAGVADQAAGTLPVMGKGVEVSRPGVLVTALRPNPNGTGTVLRLWEQAGNSGDCTVHLPSGLSPDTAVPLDLRGRSVGEPIPIRDNTLTVKMPAYAPVSLRLGD